MTYAQRAEDDYIVDLLPEHGRYLDLGAHDGRTFSNIRLLAERGWEGVCVEPAAHGFAAMVNDPPPGAILVNALIGRHRGPTPFHYSKDALSTTHAKHARKWASVAAYIPTYAVTITLGDLLDTFPGPFDFVSVDCEGTTLQIVEDLIPCLGDLGVRVLCYEHEGVNQKVPGFTEVHRTEENAILCRS